MCFMSDIALLTEPRFDAALETAADSRFLDEEDQVLSDAFARRGLETVRVAWSRPDVNWSSFRAAIFRSTWDYFRRFDAFVAWLDQVDGRTRFINPLQLIRWNMDKRYLRELASRGVSVVPTKYITPDLKTPLVRLLERMGTSEAVIKPAVSASAWHTRRVGVVDADEVDASLTEVRERTTLLLQPFQQSILHQGEVTVVMIDGEPTHAVRKVAKPGEFRIQSEYGGAVLEHQPSEEEFALARTAVQACPMPPSYARVDMVQTNAGSLALMELELIEPELWFRMCPNAAERLVGHVVRELS